MRLQPRQRNCSTPLRSTPAPVSKSRLSRNHRCRSRRRTYSQVIHRLEMPGIGDELHHTGWNACSSCHDDASRAVNTSYCRECGRTISTSSTRRLTRRPRRCTRSLTAMKSKRKPTSQAHTPSTALGSRSLSRSSEIPRSTWRLPPRHRRVRDRWPLGELDGRHPLRIRLWYQPRHNVMISSEWAAPNTFLPGSTSKKMGT